MAASFAPELVHVNVTDIWPELLAHPTDELLVGEKVLNTGPVLGGGGAALGLALGDSLGLALGLALGVSLGVSLGLADVSGLPEGVAIGAPVPREKSSVSITTTAISNSPPMIERMRISVLDVFLPFKLAEFVGFAPSGPPELVGD